MSKKTAVQFFTFAGAAFLCARSRIFIATQRKSPKQLFKAVMISESETAHSLHTEPTIKSLKRCNVQFFWQDRLLLALFEWDEQT